MYPQAKGNGLRAYRQDLNCFALENGINPQMPFDCAQEFSSSLSDQQTQQIILVLEESGIVSFLRVHPFRLLELRSNVVLQTRPVHGVYSYQTTDTKINVHRDNADFGQSYQQQAFWSISALADTKLNAIRRTLIHETGHHVHHVLRTTDPSFFRSTMLIPRSSALSQYGMQNNPEYFAEAFAAFVFQRIELFVQDKLGYDNQSGKPFRTRDKGSAMSQIINLKTLDSATLSNDLYMAFFDGRLTQVMFDEVVTELQARGTHPEVLVGLIALGLPEWQQKYTEIAF